VASISTRHPEFSHWQNPASLRFATVTSTRMSASGSTHSANKRIGSTGGRSPRQPDGGMIGPRREDGPT
jgi:hypothetical protein